VKLEEKETIPITLWTVSKDTGSSSFLNLRRKESLFLNQCLLFHPNIFVKAFWITEKYLSRRDLRLCACTEAILVYFLKTTPVT